MKVYEGDSFAQVYQVSLKDLMTSPDFQSTPRDLKVNENINVSLIINDPLQCLYYTPIRESKKKYIAAELIWYFMGRRDADFIKKYAKFWESIQNEDGTVNSSYGYLLFNKRSRFRMTQYEWALNSLIKDKDSRQAILHFNLPEHQYTTNKDFVCTMYGIFHIRENKLDFTVHMRSNDVVWGLPTDVAFFVLLQNQMLVHLQKQYPALEMGKYTHVANSYHIYERHFDAITKALEHDFVSERIPQIGQSLITYTANPSTEFSVLAENYEDTTHENFSDDLFKWIIKNIQNNE